MEIGMVVRNMGPVSTASLMSASAQYAESIGLDHIWMTDHVAIPKNESEGSGGRYVDPLATLAFFAGVTKRIQLGVGVLVLPYRPALPTAKWLASIQELSDGRLLFGAGVGWMAAEFKAAGVPRNRRGALTDETLQFVNDCFAADEVTANDQSFLFLPRPAKPPVLIGGAPENAIPRIVSHGDGWMPGRTPPDVLKGHVADLTEQMAAVGKEKPKVIVLGHLPVDEPNAAREMVEAYEDAGATGIAHFSRYADGTEFNAIADALAELRSDRRI